jgi:murein L,D-transpeptidase YcbB/YkuD
VEARIDQIRVNLERGRWLLHDLPDSFVVVNVAAFRVYLVVKGEAVWSSRCQVGKEARQTPIFRDNMRHLVFNPTWTVPPGILAKDVLPSLRRGDLSVLKRKKLKVIDKSGRVVNPGSVAWSKVSAGAYTFRQDAGPDNALGRVKFMFPNSYSVYLHDTPSRDLFEEPSRAFSSGCIRVDKPLELAERVLADPKWNAAAIQRTVDAGKTVTVTLKHPLPVLLLYWTAFPWGHGGDVAFAKDIYGRDARILKALGEAGH